MPQRSIVSVGRDALFDMSRKRLAASAAAGVWPERIHVHITPDSRGCLIHAQYEFRRIPAFGGKHVAFDLTTSALQLLECIPGSGFKTQLAHVGKAAMVLMLDDSTKSERLYMTITLLWPWSARDAAAGLDFLLLPDFLPEQLLPAIMGMHLQPHLSVKCDPRCASVTGYLSRFTSPDRDADSALLQAVVGRLGAISEQRGRAPEISLSGGIITGLSEGQRQRIENLVGRVFSFIKNYLDFNVRCQLCIVTPAELGGVRFRPTGTMLVASPKGFGLGHPEGTPADFELSASIAGIWWSGGCRFFGSGAKELQLALQTVTAQAWMEHIGLSDEGDAIEAQLEEMASTPKIKNWLMGVQGLAQPRLRANFTRQLLRSSDNGSLEVALHNILEQNWAHRLNATDALAMLRR